MNIAHDETNFKPKSLEVKAGTIPDEMKKLKNWVLWRYVHREGKWTKEPINPNIFFEAEPNKNASSTDPKTWSHFNKAFDIYANQKHEVDGVGFVLTPEAGYVAIDADKVAGTHNGDVLTKGIKSYGENSPSNNGGLRFIGRASLPENRGRKRDFLELYNSGRFVTMTGHILPDHEASITDIQPAIDRILASWFTPTSHTRTGTGATGGAALQLEDQEILDLCRAEKKPSKFDALFDADEKALVALGYVKAGGELDNSGADLALCCKLAFYSDDAAQIDRIFRTSGLYRDKWERRDYRERTVEKALDPDRERYKAPAGGASDGDMGDVVTPFDALLFEEDIILTLDSVKRRAATLKTSKIWAADKWIQVGKVGLLHGKAKRGKSTCVMDFAASLVTGEKWLKVIPCRKMPILLIDYENEEDYLADNVIPMIEAKGHESADVDDLFYVIDPQRIKQELSPFNVDKVCSYIDVVSKRANSSIGMFVIDTARPAFNKMFSESNWEWSADRVREALEQAHEVERRTGWGAIVIHHDTKAGNSPSGSGDWEGAVDYSIAYSLDTDTREATLSWWGRQVDPPADVVYTKAGAVLTGHSSEHCSQAEQALFDISVKCFVTETPQKQSDLVKLVRNGWKGDKVPAINVVRASLTRLAHDGQIKCKIGERNVHEYWTD